MSWGGFENELRIPSDTALAQEIQNRIIGALENAAFPEKVVFGIKLAIEEAIVNAIKHGNQLDRSKHVRISWTVTTREFAIEVEDQGPGFKPEDVPDPTDPENLERPCGRGLLLMRAYMTECDFIPPGNLCRMRRVLD
jgi:serine/threonine-protein kinase RsbW